MPAKSLKKGLIWIFHLSWGWYLVVGFFVCFWVLVGLFCFLLLWWWVFLFCFDFFFRGLHLCFFVCFLNPSVSIFQHFFAVFRDGNLGLLAAVTLPSLSCSMICGFQKITLYAESRELLTVHSMLMRSGGCTHSILEVVLKLRMLLIIMASSAFLEPWIATGVGTECGQAIVVCSAAVSQGGKIRGFQDLAICCPCYVSSSINAGLARKPKLCGHPYLLVPFCSCSSVEQAQKGGVWRQELTGGQSWCRQRSLSWRSATNARTATASVKKICSERLDRLGKYCCSPSAWGELVWFFCESIFIVEGNRWCPQSEVYEQASIRASSSYRRSGFGSSLMTWAGCVG